MKRLIICLSLGLITPLYADVVEQVETPQADIAIALEYFGRGQLKDSEIVYKRLIKNYPLLPEPYINLSLIYAKQNRFGEATKVINSFIAHYPNYKPALITKNRIKSMYNQHKKNK